MHQDHFHPQSTRCQWQAECASGPEEFPAAKQLPALLTYHDLSPPFAAVVHGKMVRIKRVHPLITPCGFHFSPPSWQLLPSGKLPL